MYKLTVGNKIYTEMVNLFSIKNKAKEFDVRKNIAVEYIAL